MSMSMRMSPRDLIGKARQGTTLETYWGKWGGRARNSAAGIGPWNLEGVPIMIVKEYKRQAEVGEEAAYWFTTNALALAHLYPVGQYMIDDGSQYISPVHPCGSSLLLSLSLCLISFRFDRTNFWLVKFSSWWVKLIQSFNHDPIIFSYHPSVGRSEFSL